MEHSARSDAELVELAREGSAPAFAVLLHRHGPAVRAAVSSDADPTGATIAAFVTAMRQLSDIGPAEEVRPWLLSIAADQVRDPAPVGAGALPDLDPAERDEIWAELDLRWPNGRVPAHVPGWVGWSALVAALIALGVLVPYLVLTLSFGGDELDLIQLRAEPFEDDELTLDEELVEPEPIELPVFEFPDEVEEPPPPPPEPEPEPAPPPEPEPVEEEPEEVEEEPEPVEEEPEDEEVEEDPPPDETDPDPDPDPEGDEEGQEPEDEG